METSSSLTLRVGGYVGLGVLVFSLETLGANMVGDLLPLAAWYFWPGLLITGILAGSTLLADGYLRRKIPAVDWFWCGLAVGLLLIHGYRLGVATGIVPWMVGIGLILVMFGGGRWLGFTRGGVGLFLLALLTSPNWMKLLTGSVGSWPGAPILGAGVSLFLPGIVLVGLWLFEGFLIPRLAHPMWSLGAFLLVLAAAVGVQAHWWTLQPNRAFQTRFRGSLPDVRRTGGDGVEPLPNVILISVDTLRWDLVPPWAPSSLKLPSLRKLRRDSMVFPAHFSTSSATLRSHASLFSGLLPPRHGAGKGGWRIHPDVWLYPQLLKKLGYHTGGFVGGAWVSQKLGFSRGYDRYWEYPAAYKEMVPGGIRFLEALAWTVDRGFLLRMRRKGAGGNYLRDFNVTVERALEWIRTVRGGSEDRPFYLFLHTYHAHDYKRIYPEALSRVRENHPDLLDAPFVEEVILSGSGQVYAALRRAVRPPGIRLLLDRLESSDRVQHRRYVEGLSEDQKMLLDRTLEELSIPRSLRELELSDRERDRARTQLRGWVSRLLKVQHHLYRYGVEGVDRALGRLLEFLKRNGLYEDTLIVFLSDHGEGFREDSTALGHGQGQLHEVLLRTPLFVKLPHQKRRGYRGEGLVQLTDVFPSLFRYLGLRPAVPSETAPDRPRTDLFTTPRASPRELVRGLIGTRRKAPRPNMYVRTSSYKLIESQNDARRGWYRVSMDDFTERPISEDQVPRSERRLLAREMAHYIHMERREPASSGDTEPVSNPEVRRALQGLGYLE